MNQKINLKTGVVIAMILTATLSRFIPHPPNFTPIGAMSLFGAAYFGRKYLALLIPFLALWLSDLALNNILYAQMFPEYYTQFVWFGMWSVYIAFAAIVGLGWLLLKKVTTTRLLGASVSASLIFFLITNFQVWLGPLSVYPKTIAGLFSAYAAGIPFFWNTLAGDLFFTAVLFGAFAFFQRRFPALQTQTQG